MTVPINLDTARRLRRVVERDERRPFDSMREQDGAREDDTLWPVQCSSITTTNGLYPGTLYRRTADGNTLTQIGSTGGIWLTTPNMQYAAGVRTGEILKIGPLYWAKVTGPRTDGKNILEVVNPAVSVIGKLDGNLGAGLSTTLSVWHNLIGTPADTGQDITVYSWQNTGAIGDSVIAHFDGAYWYV